jgi:outer membrane lipoprotein
MPTNPILLPLLLAVAFFSSSCSHVISRQARSEITPGVVFTAVKDAPEEHLGQVLLLGGTIVETRLGEKESTLEIFRWKLDRWGEPVAVDESGGRFLVHSKKLLDPALYQEGRLVTLTARVAGSKTRPLGTITYNYPVFELIELYLWDTPFRYGIHPHPYPYFPYYVPPDGQLHGNPYDPGYAPYPWSPYWIRP